jgi:ESS family glutamate:Na+ symporter
MQATDFAFYYECDMTVTLALAAVLLVLGHYIKRLVPLLRKFFIPAPVIGGIIFAFITLAGYQTRLFGFGFDSSLKNLLMTAFFTSVGFTASFRMLYKGGIAVCIFLVVSVLFICVQNLAGIGLAELFGLNPLIGLATGSISLTGGHGTSAAFGPLLEQNGLQAGLSVSIAAATFGLVAGSMLGGPVGRHLLASKHLEHGPRNGTNQDIVEGRLTAAQRFIDEHTLFKACCCLIIAMGIGYFVNLGVRELGIVLPAYLCPMLVAAAIRNYCDLRRIDIPLHTINLAGGISLQFFLAMALMTMRLWELADLAVPLITILVVQVVLMGLYAYFVTFRIMGGDYDAVVLAVGHCGFGLGATPNAMANMETFTGANGESPKAFFVVPLVGSLFIDFFNAIAITTFMQFLI